MALSLLLRGRNTCIENDIFLRDSPLKQLDSLRPFSQMSFIGGTNPFSLEVLLLSQPCDQKCLTKTQLPVNLYPTEPIGLQATVNVRNLPAKRIDPVEQTIGLVI